MNIESLYEIASTDAFKLLSTSLLWYSGSSSNSIVQSCPWHNFQWPEWSIENNTHWAQHAPNHRKVRVVLPALHKNCQYKISTANGWAKLQDGQRTNQFRNLDMYLNRVCGDGVNPVCPLRILLKKSQRPLRDTVLSNPDHTQTGESTSTYICESWISQLVKWLMSCNRYTVEDSRPETESQANHRVLPRISKGPSTVKLIVSLLLPQAQQTTSHY